MTSNSLSAIELREQIFSSTRQKNLLLGNGFTVGCEYEDIKHFKQFDYENLFRNIGRSLNDLNEEKIKHLDYIKSLFQKEDPKETNIEYYLLMYDELMDIIKFYKNTDYAYGNITDEKIIAKHMTTIRNCVLQTLNDIHPSSFSQILRDLKSNLICASNFIGKFHRIYTVNYDLLLYWLILFHNDINDGKCTYFRDGFTDKYRENFNMFGSLDNKYNISFLHGAIHLIEQIDESSNRVTLKIKKSNSDKIPLKQLINRIKNENERIKHLIVLEGASENKLKIINDNYYLKKCLERLSKFRQDDDIYIYGCSITDKAGKINNDRHIWERIVNSDSGKIFISIHADLGSSDYSNKKENITTALNELTLNKLKEKEIYFFSSRSLDIWTFNEQLGV
jgi:hypothetical protein